MIPFENVSKASGLDWIGEAFSEVLGQSFDSSSLYVVNRDDRSYVFDHLGIPVDAQLSRATLYRIAEQMDVDYVVFGSYDYDGNGFNARAQVLDMKRLRLSPPAVEAGALPQLIDIQHSLAWDMLRSIDPTLSVSKQDFVASTSRVRLDALENYIRGVIATSTPERVRRFKEALRINPDYIRASLQLGKTYFQARDYGAAMTAFAKVPKQDPRALEANFYLGLSAYYTGSFDRAEEAFDFVASRLPLTEVYNNLGVAQARRAKRSASAYFEKATEADPKDADYQFNLGLSLVRTGRTAEALKHLREAQNLRSSDGEIKATADAVAATGTIGSAGRGPLERIKRNYDETQFRQLSMEIQRVDELQLSRTAPHEHAMKHVERGWQFFKQGFKDSAQKEFTEAVLLDQSIAAAHLGLATTRDAENDLANARSEVAAAVKLQPTAEAYLLLAQIDLKQNNAQSANENVQRALALDPANATALSLRQSIATRLVQKGQLANTP